MNAAPIVAVVGSLNIDLTFRVPTIPRPGETLMSKGVLTSFGGKGANQALAASRAGAQVRMIGCVGDDLHGPNYRRRLEEEGLDVRGLATAAGVSTGTAVIAVDDAGENVIIVEPGANHALTPGHIDTVENLFAGADVLLAQLECPLPTVRRAAETAMRAGALVVLNPSPWTDAFRDAGIPMDALIVNETETQAFFGADPLAVAQSGDAALAKAGVSTLVLTRGGAGALALTKGAPAIQVPAPKVSPVDTVGAGDAFAGALAVAMGEKRPLKDAVAFAAAAGAAATLQLGAQSAIPTRAQILALMPSA